MPFGFIESLDHPELLYSTDRQWYGETIEGTKQYINKLQQNDINVNCVREKHLSSVRTAGKDVNIILPPVQAMTLDKAMNWIDNDEWVEVTPQNVRIRKKELQSNKRSVIRR